MRCRLGPARLRCSHSRLARTPTELASWPLGTVSAPSRYVCDDGLLEVVRIRSHIIRDLHPALEHHEVGHGSDGVSAHWWRDEIEPLRQSDLDTSHLPWWGRDCGVKHRVHVCSGRVGIG